tara:strand:+ start:1017 stop:1193 length:177 start_codon:yes stop_codon:yes gene_type:complete
MENLLTSLGFFVLIAAMIWAVRTAKNTRADSARRNKAGFHILSFGIASMMDQPTHVVR